MRFLTIVSPLSILYFERVLIDVEPETALQVFEQILQKKPIVPT